LVRIPKAESDRNALWIENTSPSRLIVLLSEVTLPLWALMEVVLQNLWKMPTAVFLFFILMASASAQVVALGASNTRGYGVNEAQSYPAQLQAMLQARGSGLRVTNEGVPGDTTGEMLARLASAVPDGTKIVILQFGTNDARLNTPPATRHANIAAILEELRKRGIRSVQVDELMDAALRDGLVQSDGIHLTAEGYRRVATQLLPSIL
jgi:acyl-CoA thioesterase-1